MSDEEWQRVIDTNLSAAFRMTRRALRTMIRTRWGRIVNVASVAGQRGARTGQLRDREGRPRALTKTVAAEVARRR